MLFIVSTPIGNLKDMTQRGIQTLHDVDIIAAEDTRHSGKLLSHFSINTAMLPYHEHNAKIQTLHILSRLAEGGKVALISDAGTPLISDPGFRLVRACHEAGYTVVPVPGACAVTTAVSAAGLPCDRYFFEGFLVARSSARRERLAELRERRETLVFYESCHRIVDTLVDMAAVLGGHREVAFCRELTKTWETLRVGTLAQISLWVAEDTDQRRGEIVLVVAGNTESEQGLDRDSQRWLLALSGEIAPSRLAAIAARITGQSKRDIYQWLCGQERTSAPD